MPPHQSSLENSVYTNYYISQDGLICHEDRGITPWFIGKGERILSSGSPRSSGDYRIEQGKIKIGRRNTGFYVRFEEEKQKIYGPAENLPWM